MSISKIIKDLDEKSHGFKPIPFWSWNEKLQKDKLLKQIDELKSDGMGGYFMHARGGLITEYLSSEWMQAISDCCDYGEKVGMDSWIYDENGWPSGFAGGKLLENEAYHDKYIEFCIGEFDATADVCYLLSCDELVKVTQKQENGEYLNLKIKVAASTVDVCQKEVVDSFIALTHEQYKAYFGNGFSKKVKGFFTDEPQYQRWGTPYSDALVKYFKEEYNQDVFEKLGLLFVEKNGYRDFRYKYWKALQSLMLNNYAKNVYDWCEKNKMQLTGHYIEETSMGYQLMCCGGVMPFYEYQHIPGIDWLGRKTDNELPVRQVSSVAAQLGKTKVLTESFACCGWDVSPNELRRIIGFQLVGGVNLLCSHLIPYSEKGVRKHDHPAHYSHENLWVEKEFATFNRYVTRLGYLMSQSREYVNVAVLHPIRSAYFDYKRGTDNDEKEFNIKSLDDNLQKDIRLLSSNGINYHFIDETVFSKHGGVKGKKLICGECEYEYLILPHNITMDASTEAYLKKYVNNGGKVLILGSKPEYIEANEYDYAYLESNCTIEEIKKAQKFAVADTDNELYYTCRTVDGTDFLVVQNGSEKRKFTQKFAFDNKIKSFSCLDMDTLELKSLPLEVTFEPNECMVLFPSETDCGLCENKDEVLFALDNDSVYFNENLLVLDNVRYSYDNTEYSKSYTVDALFSKLLKDRYDGQIYFKYEFSVKEPPRDITVSFEKLFDSELIFNGNVLPAVLQIKNNDEYLTADISGSIKTGINELVVKTNWHQNENVYYALFGENVTESLKNCLVYNTELEPIYLKGQFGVYTDGKFTDTGDGFVSANDFYIGKTPQRITEPVFDGLPFFAGIMTVNKKIKLDNINVNLRIPGKKMITTVKINGKKLKPLIFGELVDLSPYAVAGENDLEVEFVFSNRNKFGPHHNLDALSHFYVAPHYFERINSGDELFNDNFELLKFGCTGEKIV